MNRADDSDRRLGVPQELRELAPLYALGALDGPELVRFERALAGSPELQAEVDAFRGAAAQLAESVPAVEPPPGLKSALFARLDGVPQDVVPGTERETFGHGDVAPGGPIDELAARRRKRGLAVVLSAAAAVVLIAAGVVFGVNWPGPSGWGAQREYAQLAEASDARTETITVAGGGEVTLVWSAAQGRSAMRAEGLPDVGDARTYELWYIDDEGAIPAGTFDVQGGDAWRILEGEFAEGVVVGITVEPEGGSEQPTTEPIAAIPT